MYQLLEYYGKWHGFKSGFSRKPAWAKFLVGIVALPGLICVLLSILAFLVSLIVLFLPVTLVYRLVNKVTGSKSAAERPSGFGETDFVAEQQGGGFTPADERVDYEKEAEVVAPVTPVVVTPDPDARPRRQIEVKIVE